MSMNDNPTTPSGNSDFGRHADTPGERPMQPGPGAVPPPPPAPPAPEPTFEETVAAQRPIPEDLADTPHPMGGPDHDAPGKADTAKQEAQQVGHEGAESAKRVAGSAADEANKVAHEAGDKARDLMGELTSNLREQAGTQQQKVSEGLRSLGDELRSMADHGQNGGTASSLVGQAAQRAGSAADWLDNRDPGSLLDEVKDFARHRPGTFLAVAAGAGLLVGRMTRGLVGAQQDSHGDQTHAGASGGRGETDPAVRPAVPPAMATDRGTEGAPTTAPTTAPQPSIDTVGPTIGSGGVGGTGSDPGVASPGISSPGVPGTMPDERR